MSVQYLSHIIFVVISIIYNVQHRYKVIDRLIHFSVCAVCTASVATHLNNTVIALVLYTHVIRRHTNGITIMSMKHGFMDMAWATMGSLIQLSLPA